jgi:proteic killer suppression protein
MEWPTSNGDGHFTLSRETTRRGVLFGRSDPDGATRPSRWVSACAPQNPVAAADATRRMRLQSPEGRSSLLTLRIWLIATNNRIGFQPYRLYSTRTNARRVTGSGKRGSQSYRGQLTSDDCQYTNVIISFRHKGLARLYQRAERRGVTADLLPKVERILARPDVVTSAGQMDLPGWKLHPLKGKLKGFWSVWVSGNWRIIFRFTGTDAADVDLVDYH